MHMMSHGIHVYSSSFDILKRRINAELPIMKNDLVSHRMCFSHSWVMHIAYGIDYVHFKIHTIHL